MGNHMDKVMDGLYVGGYLGKKNGVWIYFVKILCVCGSCLVLGKGGRGRVLWPVQSHCALRAGQTAGDVSM